MNHLQENRLLELSRTQLGQPQIYHRGERAHLENCVSCQERIAGERKLSAEIARLKDLPYCSPSISPSFSSHLMMKLNECAKVKETTLVYFEQRTWILILALSAVMLLPLAYLSLHRLPFMLSEGVIFSLQIYRLVHVVNSLVWHVPGLLMTTLSTTAFALFVLFWRLPQTKRF